MSNPRILGPRFELCDPGPGSLTEELAEIVNDAREIEAELGLLPYRVMAVRVHWTGGEIGAGDVTRVWEREFLPRPTVTFRTVRELRNGGWVERGTVVLTGINPQYTEDEIDDLFAARLEPGDDQWIEIFVDSRDGSTKRRRFVLEAPPERRADRFDWRAVLRQQDRGRARDGRVPYAGSR